MLLIMTEFKSGYHPSIANLATNKVPNMPVGIVLQFLANAHASIPPNVFALPPGRLIKSGVGVDNGT